MPVGAFVPSEFEFDYPRWTAPGIAYNGYVWAWNNTAGKYEPTALSFDPAGTGATEAAAAVAAHVALSNPHTQYYLASGVSAYGATLASAADAAAARTALALGTSATLNVGTSANNVVQLNGSAQLPAVSGALLTNLPAGSAAGSTTQVQYNSDGVFAGDAGMTYNAATDRLTVAGGLVSPGMRPASNGTAALGWFDASGTQFVYGDTTNQRLGIGAIPVGTLHAESSTGYFTVNNNVVSIGDSATNSVSLRFSDQFAKSTFGGIELIVRRGSGGRFDFNAAQGVVSAPTTTTGNVVSFSTIGTFSRGDSSTYTALYINDSINASGVARGIHIAIIPTYAPNYRAIDIETNVGFGIRQSDSGIKNWFNAKTGFGNVSAPGALVDIDASTTARASLRVRAGTAPTTPNAGDIWYASGGRLSLYRAATEIFATGVQATGGAATAGASYTSAEQSMLQKVYDACRAFGLLS